MNRNLLTLMLGVAGALQATEVAHAQQFIVPASAKAEIIDATNAYRKSKASNLCARARAQAASRKPMLTTWLRPKRPATVPMVETLFSGCERRASNSASSWARTGCVLDPARQGLSGHCHGVSHGLLEEISWS